MNLDFNFNDKGRFNARVSTVIKYESIKRRNK